MQIRPAAVAGIFYPADPEILTRDLNTFLASVQRAEPTPKALIVPHAGYIYSGAVAASAYGQVNRLRQIVERVVLLGPSHRVALQDMAVPSVDAFETPLGRIPLDRPVLEKLVAADLVQVWDAPHAQDHALEVQLPFLQTQLDAFSLVPIAVGQCDAQPVAQVLDALWGGPETLIVVSSDLSHFHDYETARALDQATADAICKREGHLSGTQACGCHAVNGLMLSARRKNLAVTLLDLRNSGDTAGGPDRVVGYGSFAIHAA